MFTWGCIVALLAIVIVCRVVFRGINHYSSRRCPSRRHRIVEVGTESEELYAPGDRFPSERDDYE